MDKEKFAALVAECEERISTGEYCLEDVAIVWASYEIEDISSHAEKLSTVAAHALGALPTGSSVNKPLALVLNDYSNRDA